MAKQKFEKFTSPKGTARFARLNNPDTEYHKEGRYQTDLILDREDAGVEKFLEKVDAKVSESYEQARKNAKSAAAKKKIEAEYPYEEELDDETEEPTGRVIFRRLHKKASAEQEDGTVRKFNLPLFGPNAKPTDKIIGNGSTIKVSGHFFPYLRDGTKAGCSLRMDAVQATKIVAGGADASAFGFEAEEDAEDEEDEGFQDESEGDDADDDGDF